VALAPKAPIWLAATDIPAVQATLLRIFRKTWPTDQLSDMARYMGVNSAAVRCAAMEILIEKASDELLRFLPRLLAVDDPRLRSLAVQGLVAIDLDGALEHIEAMLLNPQPEMRGFALRNCLFLPFEQVRDMILKSIAVECFPELIEKAGAILMSNPEPEVPFRLWEIIELAAPKLQEPLKAVLRGVSQALNDSGLLTDTYAAYQNHLQEWVQRRVAVRQVQSWLEDTAPKGAGLEYPVTGGEEEEEETAPDPKLPVSQWALQQALTWDIPSAQKARIRNLLAPPTAQKVEAVSATPTARAFQEPYQTPAVASTTPATFPATTLATSPATTPATSPATTLATSPSTSKGASPTAATSAIVSTAPALTTAAAAGAVATTPATIVSAEALSPPDMEKSLLLQLNQLRENDRDGALRLVGELLSCSNLDPAIGAAAFKTALRLRIFAFSAHAERHLRNGHEPLVAAAIEYLGFVEPDRLMPFLGRFLQSRTHRIRVAALEVIRRLDPTRALSALKFMLSNKDEIEQEHALACMVHFEFSVVRRTLLDFLKSGPSEPLLIKGICLFQANPDKENIFPLYCLEKLFLSPLDAKIGKIREATVQTLQEMGFSIHNDLLNEAALEKRRLQEEERRRKPSPYALSQTKTDKPQKPFLQRVLESVGITDGVRVSSSELGLAGLAVIVTIVGWLSFNWAEAPQETQATMRPGAVLAERLEVTGYITGVQHDQIQGVAFEMKGNDGLQFSIDSAVGLPLIAPGDHVKATLLPIRIARNGIVIARCLSLQIVKPGGTLPDTN